MIEIKGLTKDYGAGRGVFDLDLTIKKGEVLGYLGPNGAGKTTTIRHLLGFIKADSGSAYIDGLNTIEKRELIMRKVGYLPAETAFFDGMNGREFLDFISGMHQLSSTTFRNELIDRFEIDTNVGLRKMSKGMKQKIALVAAFMHQPEVLILDEPTSGLDPLMQREFNELILEEKQRGATILMSSHSFDEVERTCDRIAIIRQGKLVVVEDIDTIKSKQKKYFEIEFSSIDDANRFVSEFGGELNNRLVKVAVTADLNTFIATLLNYDVTNLVSQSASLEEVFMHYYK
ncbi:MAG: ABC transporter ATP-binding protein [bacterium]